jgi:hypothetical protein
MIEDGRRPLELTVYDAAGTPQDTVVPASCAFVPRWNRVGTGALVIDHDDPQAEVLTANGSRLGVRYRYDPADPSATMHVMTGAIQERELKGDLGKRLRAFTVADDSDLFDYLLGWPNPTGTETQQGDDEVYDTRTGPAETVLKAFVSANLSHHPSRLPIVVPASLGRGASISASLRFHPLRDRLWPAVDAAGITVSVRQDAATLRLEVDVPDVYPETLTEASGVVAPDSELALTPPTCTRALVLGQGEGLARQVVLVAPGGSRTTRTPLEQEWGMIREVVIDARDTNDPAVLAVRGAQAIAEGAPQAKGTVRLSETEDFRYGVAVNLGTTVTVELNGQPAITDRVREVTLAWDAESGLSVTPAIGDAPRSQQDAIRRALNNVLRVQRDLIAGR